MKKLIGVFFALLLVFGINTSSVFASTYGEGNYGINKFGEGEPANTSTNNTSSTTTTTSSSSGGEQSPGSKASWLYGAIAQDSSSVILYFAAADEPITKYVLEYGTKSGEYPYGVQDMGVNSRGSMTYLVKSLSPNTTYYFRVRGDNGSATGSWSNEISAKTKGRFSLNQLNIVSSQLEAGEPETEPDQGCQTYTVKSGDTLWLIAKNILGNGSKYQEIIKQNQDQYPTLKESNSLKTGWELKVNCEKDNKEAQSSDSGEAVGKSYAVKVKVVDTTKKPVEGATITLHSNPQTTKTDKDGIATFKNVEEGDHKILIAYKNFEGEQTVNLTGDVKEFALNLTIEQKPMFLSPLAYGIIGVMALVILFLIVLLKKSKRKI